MKDPGALHWSPVPACLRYIDSDGEKRSVFLLPDGCAIGLRPSKHLICLSDPHISTGHAWIEQREDGFWVSDMGSANGTLVNDRRVMSSPLRHGDILRCGETALRFESTPSSTRAPVAGLLYFSPSGQRMTAPLRPDGALLGSFQEARSTPSTTASPASMPSCTARTTSGWCCRSRHATKPR